MTENTHSIAKGKCVQKSKEDPHRDDDDELLVAKVKKVMATVRAANDSANQERCACDKAIDKLTGRIQKLKQIRKKAIERHQSLKEKNKKWETVQQELTKVSYVHQSCSCSICCISDASLCASPAVRRGAIGKITRLCRQQPGFG